MSIAQQSATIYTVPVQRRHTLWGRFVLQWGPAALADRREYSAVNEIIWLGMLLGVGAAFSVGPIFVTIVQEAATRGFMASFRVILGSATADLILLLPAIAFSWLIAQIAAASFWVGLLGAIFLIYFAIEALRDARRLWANVSAPPTPAGWSFWKGVIGNLANPLTWTFWLATGTPTMLRSYELGGAPGLLLFTLIWFVVASGLEAVIALVIARSGSMIGARGQAVFTSFSGVMFLGLAGILLVQSVLA
ncbi:MAG: LysE family transporter [Oscillochloris sp.]|nr:LysE family transporter [Oscillochloris sp.]